MNISEYNSLPVKRLVALAAELDAEAVMHGEAAKASQKQQAECKRRADHCRSLATEKSKPTASITISDHAMVRYLERVKGFDLDMFRNEILTEDRRQKIEAGITSIKADGYEMKISGNVVTTIV